MMKEKIDLSQKMRELLEIQRSNNKNDDRIKELEEKEKYCRKLQEEYYQELKSIQNKIESNESSIFIYKELRKLLQRYTFDDE